MKLNSIVINLVAILALSCATGESEGSSSSSNSTNNASSSISISPTSGSVGTLVTISADSGYDLSTLSSVTVNGVAAIIVSKETGTARALVMPGSTTGPITATTPAGSHSASFTITTASPIATQQGAKLIGTGNIGNSNQGGRIAISADGNTAILGGEKDNSDQGAAWVFTRSGDTWSQQGTKLVGTGNIGSAWQGCDVAISADGNTVIIGGSMDNSEQGAAWVFRRTGSTWAQQGGKLVGSGNVGAARQGHSVALSADGNTALLGGWADNSHNGAAWVFVRSGTTWVQQGSKLVGSGNTGAAKQGIAVALAADGNTALIGGDNDNSDGIVAHGATWVFARSGTNWSQQGGKLVGTGYANRAGQGRSVTLSADGNTAVIGGPEDDSYQGAAWVFVRNGTTWSQQGTKLIGTGVTGNARQGTGVSVSADGNTALVGGSQDNTNQGATWIFRRNGTNWAQQGTKLVGTGNTGAASQGWDVSLSADGRTAIVGGWNDNSSYGAAWVFVP